MARWVEFAAAEPEMAEAGRKLIYQFGVGLGFLATVRPDGGPRLHPICLNQVGDGLYGLIAATPKRADLVRDGRFALHTFPPVEVDDEFYLTGRATLIEDEETRKQVEQAQIDSGATTSGDEWCFEFDIERALLATYEKRPSWPPVYRKWKA
jgi:hypothetical protein